MPQFTVFRNNNRSTQKSYPYLLDIQSNLLSELRTTVVIPLMPRKLAEGHVISRLNPSVKIRNESLVLMTQSIAGVDRSILGDGAGDLSDYRAEIIAAVDFVLSGI